MAIPEGSTMEHQAVIECTQDPCSYCRTGAARRVAAHSQGPFSTPEAAGEHGLAIARNVYGASTHRVLVSSRVVSPWSEPVAFRPQASVGGA